MTTLGDLPWTDDRGDTVTAVIEIPSGSRQKIEYDQIHDCFRLDRVLNMTMPGNYGFIPQTLCEDGDALDVLVIGDDVLSTGTVLCVKPIGLIAMEDDGVLDHKVLAIPDYMELSDLPKSLRSGRTQRPLFGSILNFFQQYKGDGHTKVGEYVLPLTDALIEIENSVDEYAAASRAV